VTVLFRENSKALPVTRTKHRGFTLIEILVVLLIVGIVIGFAVVAFGDFGASRRVKFAAEQFINDVKMAQHQAILETATFGVLVGNSTFQVYRYDSVNHWQTLKTNKVFRRYEFPDQVALHFQPNIESFKTPQIIINESGDMNSFTLIIDYKGEELAAIIGHHTGALELKMKPST
jgi:general secretion pathway protein H